MSVNTSGASASANFSGPVGESIFSRYHVFLDYFRNRVIFEPTPEPDKPFPERKTYGLSLLASGDDLHTCTVSAVHPDSAAAVEEVMWHSRPRHGKANSWGTAAPRLWF